MPSFASLPWETIEQHEPITQEKDEQILEAFSTHWIKYVLPTFLHALLTGMSVLLLLTALSIETETIQAAQALALAAAALLTASHHWFFYCILSEGMEDIVLTSKRIICFENKIFVRDDMHEATLERIRAVEAHKRGILQNILSYGNLWLDTGGSDVYQGAIARVPHPHRKAKAIMRLLKMR